MPPKTGGAKKRVRGVYGGPWEKLSKITVTREILEKLALCLIEALVLEAKKDFAKRGWSLNDPKRGAPLHKSFAFRIRGKSTIEITSTFWGLKELTTGDLPERKMTWMTQEAKERRPANYRLSPRERRLGMKKGGRISKGERLPLIVPLQQKNGTVIFRAAPLTFEKAWVHPGIAKFTFIQRGIRKGRKACIQQIQQFVVDQLTA